MKQQLKAILVVVAIVIIGGALLFLARTGGVDLVLKDPFVGVENAPIHIEEFSDFQCPACRAAAPIIKELVKQYPDQVKLTYRDFPLPSHDEAKSAAVAALCAGQQGQFFEFHDRLFTGQSEWESTNTDIDPFINKLIADLGLDVAAMDTCRNSRQARSEVERDFDEGQERGVDSTPSFFVDGNKIQNPGSLFAWRQFIDDLLEEKGLSQPTEDSDETADSAGEDQEIESES